jgi:hypothetical protein
MEPALSEAETSLLSNWRNSDLCVGLTNIMGCRYSIGEKLTRDQASKFEAIHLLFPEPPAPRTMGRARPHYSVREVWERVWNFIRNFPALGASSIERILMKFQYVTAIANNNQ